MAIKTTGAELKEFIDSWPEGWWFEDEVFVVNGVLLANPDYTEFKPTDEVAVRAGVIYRGDYHDTAPFTLQFKRWRKEQQVVTVLISVPKDTPLSDLVEALGPLGAKIISGGPK